MKRPRRNHSAAFDELHLMAPFYDARKVAAQLRRTPSADT